MPTETSAALASHGKSMLWPSALVARALTPDPAARALAFGRCWRDPQGGGLLLSLEAAQILDEPPGQHARMEDCLTAVLPEDLPALTDLLRDGAPPGQERDCEFRVAKGSEGLRWLRLVVLPGAARGAEAAEALLTDITALKHAALREEFSFESTQLMIGAHTLDEAVSKMIRLICTDLGWDCGMYWSCEQFGSGELRLVCSHFWSRSLRATPDSLYGAGTRLSIGVHEGVVGAVWNSGQARWIEDISTDPEFLWPAYARQAGLRAGYAFPVAYESEDGRRHKPGVLIFFSCLARQRTAQLPNLSAGIGALIAQTAQRVAQQESIRELAQVDALSGLANRRHFHDLLDQACERASQRKASLGVLYIDLDRFKPINDGLGHEAGDIVLREFARRLAALTPPGGQAGRVGGDEFAVFLHADEHGVRLKQVAEQVLQAARASFHVSGRELVISASVGISQCPGDGTQAAELLRHADGAMYRVKHSGRNGLCFHSHDEGSGHAASQRALLQRLTVEAELLHALDEGQLYLEYQPVFNTETRKVRAVEALIRWRRPNGEVVRPDLFIPIAEQSHLIVAIGRWVIRQACRDLADMEQAGMARVQVNVNMSALEFMNDKLPEELAAVVLEAGVDPRQVCLELTEGMMMNHAERVVPVMRALRRCGFRISVDDFGMGYSSLSRLKDLPISSLKIDRSFVHGLPSDHQDRAIVQTIIDIGRNMRLDVIAEGVETEAQLHHLRQLGCSLVQGYLTGRPMPLNALIDAHGAPLVVV
jgi:diguanylate cyclase (GGDEF)-like protein